MAKPSRPRLDRAVYYVLTIETWTWDWSFGINNVAALGPLAFNDFRHLVLSGSLLRPKQFTDQKAEITFIPSAGWEKVLRSDLKKDSITNLNLRRGKVAATVPMPLDALGPLLTVLAADRLHYLVLEGEAAERGSASIRRYSFQDTFDSDDLPPDK